MGTRDIYIATGLTLIFIIVFDVLLNDESRFCILPQDFKEFYENIDADISHEDYVKARTTVDKYIEQKEAEPKEQKKAVSVANVSTKPFYAK
jgi:hypothetical protein